ncbi:hypothetical protein D3C81_1855340 [compost metagenome]
MRLLGEEQVTIRSPTPARPRKVIGLAPWLTAKRVISARARVISMLLVFSPMPRATAMPAMIA